MDAERDLPQGTAEDSASTYSQQVEDIANLLEDPATDLQEDEGHDAADDKSEEDDIINAEDVEEATAEADNGPEEATYKGGQFVPDTGKVTLDDGTTITVAELKRNNLYQRDYTKKTTEHAEAVKAFSSQKSQVDQQAQSLSQAVEYLNWYAENYLPKAPTPPEKADDYVGWIEYQKAKASFDQEQQLRAYFQQQTQANTERQRQEAEQARRERVGKEIEQLEAKDALFRDDAKGKAWFARAQELGGEYYGFAPEEIRGAIQDHRLVLALRDAFRWRAQKAKAATVKDDVRKPVIAPGGRRPEPNQQVNRQRQARSEQLRKTGSFEAGVASLMDLDL